MNYLDRNEFNYAPSEKVLEAIKQFDPAKLCFYTRIYDEGKKSIFSVLLSELYGIDESQVLLGYGGEDILKNAIHYFLSLPTSNRTILVPKFSWWYYKSISSEVPGSECKLYPLYEADDSYEYDFVAMEKMLKEEQPAVLLLASPNNPTGNCLSAEDIDRIMSWTTPATVVIVDEAYASFVLDDNTYVKKLIDKYPNLLMIRTLSKFFGLPGLRMGFGFMGTAFTDFAKYANKYLGYNRFSEEVACAAIRSEEHYRQIANNMQLDRDMYTTEIGALPGFKVYKSTANFILIKYPIELKEALENAFKEKDYKIKFMNEPDINTHMRITLGRREQNRVVADIIKAIANK